MIPIVATGTWMYGGTVQRHVWIVESDDDFWFEVAREDGTLEPGEPRG